MLKKIIKVIKDAFLPDKLNQVIFFVTSQCNSRCRHCFYWKNLGEPGDLSLKEIEKISSLLPNFNDLLLSGGEPFLREDLPDIVKIFRKQNQIKTVNIPTNGLLKEKILKDVLKISEDNHGLDIYINFSLDGPERIHDYIRQVPGNFEKTIDSLKAFYKISENKPNIFAALTTVVGLDNFKHLEELMDYVEKLKLPEVLHYFEIVRGEPREENLKEKISLKDHQELYQKILDYQKRKFLDFYRGQAFSVFKAKSAMAHLRYFYQIQAKNYFENRAWPMNCVAGRNILVIDYNGDLRACELRKKIINFKENDYKIFDLRKIFQDERDKIKKEKCSCTHSCFLFQSLHYSPKTMLFGIIPILIKNLF